MKNWKSLLSALITLCILLSFASCKTEESGSSTEGTSNASTTTSEDDDFDVEIPLETNESGTSVSRTSSNTSNTTSGSTNNNNNNGLKIDGESWDQVLAKMPQSLKGTTVEIYHWNPANEITGATKVISDFEKATGITVKWTVEQYGTYLSKLAARVGAGSSPDLVHTKTGLPAELVSLQPISASGYDFNDAAWDKWTMNAYTVNGKTYGMSLENTHIQSPDMLFYNKSVISKYDLPDPYTLWKQGKWNYDKFLEINRMFMKDAKADGAWSAGSDVGINSYLSWFGVQGALKFDGSKYSSSLKDSKFIKSTQDALDLLNNEKLMARWDPKSFEQGKLLFFSAYGILARRTNAYFSSMKSSGTLGVVPNPDIPGQPRYQGFIELESFGIAKGSKNPQAGPYFLRYYLDSSNYNVDSFFASAEALDVYKFCMQQKNKVMLTGLGLDSVYFGGTNEFWDKLDDATGAQVPNLLNQYASLIDEQVKRFNEQLNLLK